LFADNTLIPQNWTDAHLKNVEKTPGQIKGLRFMLDRVADDAETYA
jgi:hypothetical protein